MSLVPSITVFVIGLFVHRENAIKLLRKMLTMLTSGGTTGSANTNEAANENANGQDDETNEAATTANKNANSQDDETNEADIPANGQAGETTPLLI